MKKVIAILVSWFFLVNMVGCSDGPPKPTGKKVISQVAEISTNILSRSIAAHCLSMVRGKDPMKNLTGNETYEVYMKDSPIVLGTDPKQAEFIECYEPRLNWVDIKVVDIRPIDINEELKQVSAVANLIVNDMDRKIPIKYMAQNVDGNVYVEVYNFDPIMVIDGVVMSYDKNNPDSSWVYYK